jgi:hypothetical protein
MDEKQAVNGEGTLEQKLQHVHSDFVADIWRAWKDNRSESATSIDSEKFSRISVVSLTQVAATTAVDVGMTEEQFLGVCQANFAEAFKRAPRWG